FHLTMTSRDGYTYAISVVRQQRASPPPSKNFEPRPNRAMSTRIWNWLATTRTLRIIVKRSGFLAKVWRPLLVPQVSDSCFGCLQDILHLMEKHPRLSLLLLDCVQKAVEERQR